MSKTISFIFLFPRLPVTNRIRILPSPKLDPSTLFPIRFNLQIHTKLLSLPIEINFVVKRICYLFVVSPRCCANLYSTDTHRVLQHFSTNLDLVSMLVLINFHDSEFTLSDKQDNGNFGLVSSQSNTNVGVIWIHYKLSFLIHFKEQVACLHKELLLIIFCYLNILLIIRNKFACLKISVVSDIFAEPFHVRLVCPSTFDAGSILHCDIGERDILINEWYFLQLSFFVDVEHDFGLDLGEEVSITLKTHIHIFILLG